MSSPLIDRDAFHAAAVAALASVAPPLGEGLVFRLVAPLQREFWTPPADVAGHHGPNPLNGKKLERAKEAQPLEHGRDRRRTRAIER